MSKKNCRLYKNTSIKRRRRKNFREITCFKFAVSGRKNRILSQKGCTLPREENAEFIAVTS